MTTILRAVADYGLKRTIIYPNTDRGHSGIIEAIEEHRNHRPSREVRVFRSLPYEAYLRRLLRADVLVGNSSSGVIEAAAAGTPAVNIGDRQKGRERDKTMVVDALETQRSVFSAIGRVLRLGPGKSRSSIYGDGKAGIRIARRLAAVSLDESFRRKLPRPLTKGI